MGDMENQMGADDYEFECQEAWAESEKQRKAALERTRLASIKEQEKVQAMWQRTTKIMRALHEAELEEERQAQREEELRVMREAKCRAVLEEECEAGLKAKQEAELTAKQEAECKEKLQAQCEAERRATLRAQREAEREEHLRAQREEDLRAIEKQNAQDREFERRKQKVNFNQGREERKAILYRQITQKATEYRRLETQRRELRAQESMISKAEKRLEDLHALTAQATEAISNEELRKIQEEAESLEERLEKYRTSFGTNYQLQQQAYEKDRRICGLQEELAALESEQFKNDTGNSIHDPDDQEWMQAWTQDVGDVQAHVFRRQRRRLRYQVKQPEDTSLNTLPVDDSLWL